MLFTPGTNYTVTPFAQATEEQARSPFEGKFWPQYWAVHAALPKLAQDASVLLMSGAAARPSGRRRRLRRRQRRHRGTGQGLATELAPRRVNAIAPGTIDSDLWQARPAELREAAFAQYRASTLLQAVGQVDDVANAAWMLLEPLHDRHDVLRRRRLRAALNRRPSARPA